MFTNIWVITSSNKKCKTIELKTVEEDQEDEKNLNDEEVRKFKIMLINKANRKQKQGNGLFVKKNDFE